MVLQNKQNIFYTLVTLNYRDQSKKDTMKQMQQLLCTSRDRKINNSTKTKQEIEKA